MVLWEKPITPSRANVARHMYIYTTVLLHFYSLPILLLYCCIGVSFYGLRVPNQDTLFIQSLIYYYKHALYDPLGQ